MATTQTLIDAFNNTLLNTSLWTQFTGGGATFTYDITGVTVNYPASSTASTDGDLSSVSTYDLTASYAYLHVITVPSSGTSADAELRIKVDANNHVRWVYEAGTLYAQKKIAGITTSLFSVAYSASTHAWWRIRESAGTVYWDTSTDGISWTNRTSFLNVLTITAITVLIAGTCFQNETSPGAYKWNNFNTNMVVNVSDSLTFTESTGLFLLSIRTSDTVTFTESVAVSFGDNFLSLFFNGIDLGGLGNTNIIRIELHNHPTRELTNFKLARQDGSKLVNAEYTEKIVRVQGYIAATDRATYEVERDLLLQYLAPQEVTLQFSQAGANRNYTATVQNIIWSENEGGLGIFDIEFLCSAPFGQDTSTTTPVNAVTITTITSTQTFTAIAGTYKAQPTITVVVTTMTGGISKYIKITNPANSKAVTITRTWANADSLVIDCAAQTCKVNGTLVDYTGVFPEWFIGDLQVQYDDTFTTRSVSLTFAYTLRYL